MASTNPSTDSQVYQYHMAGAMTAVHSTALCSSKHQRDQRKEEIERKIPTPPGPTTESLIRLQVEPKDRASDVRAVE